MARLFLKEVDVNTNSGYSKGYKFKLEVIENSYSIENNSSNVTINYYGAKYPAWGYEDYSGPRSTIKVDGIQKVTNQIKSMQNTTYKILSSWTGDIEHNSDGKKTINVEAIWSGSATSYLPAPHTITANVPLTYIPRTSSFTANNVEIEGICTININRAADFTHKLLYNFGSLSGTIVSNIATSYNWSIPISFYNQIPNSKSGTCTITCITYSGSTEIGRETKSITINCNETKCKPIITATIKDINEVTKDLTGNESKIIKYMSNVKIEPVATAKNGASITKITVNDIITSSDTVINGVTANDFTIVATDSRGFSNSLLKNVDMIDYIPLTCDITAKRYNQASDQVRLIYSGNYFNNNFGDKTNVLTMSWKYRIKGSTDWIEGGAITPDLNGNTFNGEFLCNANFNYQQNYEIAVNFSDRLANFTTIIPLTKGHGAFTITKNGVKINGVNLYDIIYPLNSIKLWYDNEDHSEYLGFTWELVAKGRNIVGRDPTQDNFKTVGNQGGSAELQKHTHTLSGTATKTNLTGRMGQIYSGQDANVIAEGIVSSKEVTSHRLYSQGEAAINTWANWSLDASHSHTLSGTANEAGTGNSGNWAPYEVIAIWRRKL